MAINTSEVLIETVVKNAIQAIKDNPKRSIRNLVDMAANFSTGRFHREFFTTVQTMLKDQHSLYYELVSDTVAHVDSGRLLRFGMNLGYNSCTAGAGIIREIEEKECFNVPWSISVEIDGNTLDTTGSRYDSIISQGEAMGIYTWLLFVKGQTQFLPLLTAKHQKSAFVILCEPSDITEKFLDCVSEYNNIMLAVHYNNDAYDLCAKMRQRSLLYSVYYFYNKADIEKISAGELFLHSEQLNSVFTILFPVKECKNEISESVYEYGKLIRNEHMFQTIPFDAYGDSKKIDGIISKDPCIIGFNKNGQLCSLPDEKPLGSFNLFRNSLHDILMNAFPKPHLCEVQQ